MRRDAALYEQAPPRTGRRGVPRTKGERLPTPAALSSSLPPRSWTKPDVEVRGTTVAKLVHTRDVLWYRVNKSDLVHLVIVRDPHGIEPDDYFTTDLAGSTAEVVSRYADGWAIEVCFGDVKQDLGGQNPQSFTRRGPERAAALSLWLHAAIWCSCLKECESPPLWMVTITALSLVGVSCFRRGDPRRDREGQHR